MDKYWPFHLQKESISFSTDKNQMVHSKGWLEKAQQSYYLQREEGKGNQQEMMENPGTSNSQIYMYYFIFNSQGKYSDICWAYHKLLTSGSWQFQH